MVRKFPLHLANVVRHLHLLYLVECSWRWLEINNKKKNYAEILCLASKIFHLFHEMCQNMFDWESFANPKWFLIKGSLLETLLETNEAAKWSKRSDEKKQVKTNVFTGLLVDDMLSLSSFKSILNEPSLLSEYVFCSSNTFLFVPRSFLPLGLTAVTSSSSTRDCW